MDTPVRRETPQDRYNKNHTRMMGFRFNLTHDADILQKLDAEPNKQGYVKRLIREDIAREQDADA